MQTQKEDILSIFLPLLKENFMFDKRVETSKEIK